MSDVLRELHINCQNVKMFGQANGTLKFLNYYHGCHGNTNGWRNKDIFGYGRNNKKLASMKKQMVSMN